MCGIGERVPCGRAAFLVLLLVAAFVLLAAPLARAASIGVVVENPSYATIAVDRTGIAYGVSIQSGDATAGRRLYASSDEGATWTAIADFPAGSNIKTISVLSDNTLIASVDFGARSLWRSDDGGHTWTQVLVFPVIAVGLDYQILTSQSISDDGRYDYVGSYSTLDGGNHDNWVFRSADDGRTWSIVRETTNHRHIHFVQVDPTTGYVYVGYGDSSQQAMIERSTDHGQTWQALCSGTACTVVDMAFDPTGFGIYGTDTPSTPGVIERVDLGSGALTQVAPLIGTSYSTLSLGGGAWVVGATHEPNGVYPTGDTNVHVYASTDDGRTFADALQRPYRDPAGYVAAMVQFKFPNGDFPIQVTGYGTLVGRILRTPPNQLVTDGDIEAQPSDFFQTFGTATFQWDGTTAHDGTHSLRIDSSVTGLSRWNTQLLPVVPGHHYTLSGWLKTQSASGAELVANYWDASRNYIGVSYGAGQIAGTNGWTLSSVQTLAPPGAAYVRVEARLLGVGTLWADGLSLVDTNGSQAPQPVTPPAIGTAPAVGATISATAGTWTGSPGSFGFRWRRCNAAGAACADLAAVGASYVVSSADVGSTLAVAVTATNAAGSTTNMSAATGVVGAAPLPSLPAIVAAPTLTGLPTSTGTLTASTGTWSGSPTSFSYRWSRCAAGTCTVVSGVTGSSYPESAADVGFSLVVQVSATNAAGGGAAESAPSAVVTTGSTGPYTSLFADPGCTAVVLSDGTLRATIAGGADTVDSAYGTIDFGGASGFTGGVFIRDLIGLAAGQVLNANLAVLQMRDVSNGLVYELYVASDRTLRLWSPAGGLTATSINVSTGIVVPNDGASTIRIEVSAVPNASITVRVNGTDRIALTLAGGATTGNQRYLRVGIDHYDTTTTNEPVSVFHSSVATSQSGWLGAPGTTPPPANTALPAITGTPQQGQTLTASAGSWSNSPTSFGYQWQRCSGSCADIMGATASTYTLVAADVGSTIRVGVTATNGGGTSSVAYSAPTAVVVAPTASGPPQHVATASFGAYGTTDSQSFTVPTGQNEVLLFEFAGKNGSDAISSATYGGQALTLLGARSQGTVRVELWYLLAPPTGANTLTWTKTGASQNVTWGVSVYSGVNQATPFGALAQAGVTQDGSQAAKTVAVTSSSGDLVVDTAVFNGGSASAGPTAGAAQTTRWSRNLSTTQGGSSTQPGGAGTTSSWTPSGSPQYDWAILATALHPAP